MTLSEELQWRGFVNQTTLTDIDELNKNKLTFYWGVDPSARSMTVGNLAIAMMVRHFIDHGHKAVLLVGGATGMIGDPDGKAEERDLKSPDEITANKAGISKQYERIFEGQEFTLVDNYEWFKNINYLDFLRDIGKHFSMTQMLQRDFVKQRIGEGGAGISYAEFSYTLIQGYDFLHLNRKYGVTLQVCGSDQWGNSISGVGLIRKLEGKEAHVWSAPLVTNKTTGKKFGKSEDGAVWLDESLTSVYKFYQFWLNVDDASVIDYLKIYTLLDKAEIEKQTAFLKQRPEDRVAQKTLALEVTSIVHGRERAENVKKVTEALFEEGHLDALSKDQLALLADEIPTADSGQTVVSALVQSGIASSNGDARRLIDSGAVSISGEKITEDRHISASPVLLKKGKNSFLLIR